jgi:cell division protein ZapE
LSIAIETPPQALSLVSHYRDLAAKGEISLDDAQLAAAARFDALNARLNRPPAKGRSLGRLFRPSATAAVKGLYVHGEVGRGKTMLMDAFFPLAAVERKRRAHFHEFMAEVHERVHAARKSSKANGQKGEDPIAAVAAEIAAETRLLCLDEFMVTDITDAMILSRLFSQLFERGLVLVATSNSPPEELYRHGLNRALFLPFIDLLKQRAEIIRLAARTDYRLEKLGGAPVYVTPLGPDADAALDAIWRRLTGTEHGKSMALPMKGREIHVPQTEKGVARFDFADLCQKPLGAGDFLKIARSFHTVMIDHIPVLKDGERNAARRFISLIDSLYDNRVKLVASAATEPTGIYTAQDGPEASSFQRAASRLIEMRSEEYLALPHGSVGEAGHSH